MVKFEIKYEDSMSDTCPYIVLKNFRKPRRSPDFICQNMNKFWFKEMRCSADDDVTPLAVCPISGLIMWLDAMDQNTWILECKEVQDAYLAWVVEQALLV